MFLNLLQESNKELFLKVCVHAALANEIFAEEEKDMIYAYCHEMNIAEHIPENVEKLDEVVHSLNAQADEVEKKIIVLEVLGLIKADGVYDEKEKDFMKMLVKKMNVKEDVLSQYNSLLEIYLAVCKELRAAVCE
ncbi:MAG: hypothetical protein NC231_07250 [Bacillus sp. (in: Bacteria)]|nr:hypothetical protein [Bacillus sp. (in: firmicutes)]MCM1426458.1 hypothetical protein [Eubacterium sp.]